LFEFPKPCLNNLAILHISVQLILDALQAMSDRMIFVLETIESFIDGTKMPKHIDESRPA